MSDQDKLGFVDLAVHAMTMVNRPMTIAQLWEFVLANKLHHRLRSYDVSTESFIGKSPERTFRAIITRNKHIFEEVPDTKPKQYILNSQQSRQAQSDVTDNSSQIAHRSDKYHERDLHPVLTYFLKSDEYFQAYSKTIFHEVSPKGTKGEDKWLYPDMVAVHFEYANYQKSSVLNFITKFNKPPIKIYSFEIKKELNFSNYKESFFQAVSNSSWANEGYLVAAQILPDGQFIEALKKLSQSFGIGIIELNRREISQSKILSPAKFKDMMDYSVVDELANKNANFSQFLKTITDFDVNHPHRFKGEFDKILNLQELNDINH
ncbi:membrane protein [Moraxella canis]|uniref:membrane protein n=1 Tax=Moraxella canis TaxID=90239 RepID=UPI000666A6D0|nr:membrane protein [Moraxella canis]